MVSIRWYVWHVSKSSWAVPVNSRYYPLEAAEESATGGQLASPASTPEASLGYWWQACNKANADPNRVLNRYQFCDSM